MSKYKCVIFDCDGVLVDSEPIGNGVMVDMANELGANINLDYAMLHFKGNALEHCFGHINDIVENEIPKNFESEYRRRSYMRFKKEIKPIEGINEVLYKLKTPFCVASSGPQNKIELNLRLTGLLPLFEGKIFSCYSINKWKPDPAVFQWAAETMGFLNHECVIIEDSKFGVEAAKRGGFDVFGFTAHDYRNELVNADKTFKNMNELLGLLL